MRKELGELDLLDVNGGTVILSEDYGVVGFSSTRERFYFSCDYDTAYALYRRLYKENKDSMSNAEFDALCKKEFAAAGYIDLTKSF